MLILLAKVYPQSYGIDSLADYHVHNGRRTYILYTYVFHLKFF